MQNTDITSARRGAIFFIAMLSFFQIVMGFLLITGEEPSSDIAVAFASENIVLTELSIK